MSRINLSFDCDLCFGSGEVNDEDGRLQKCPGCNGTGFTFSPDELAKPIVDPSKWVDQ